MIYLLVETVQLVVVNLQVLGRLLTPRQLIQAHLKNIGNFNHGIKLGGSRAPFPAIVDPRING